MTRKVLLISGALVVALVALVAVRACGEKKRTPEEMLRARIEQAADAAQKRDLETLREFISEDYVDGRGRDKQALKELLTLTFLRYRSGLLTVYLVDNDARVDPGEPPQTAHAEVTVITTRHKRVAKLADLAPTSGSAYVFELDFALEDGDEWRITRASWSRGPSLQELLGDDDS